MTQRSIQIRIICNNSDGETIAKAVAAGMKAAGLEPLNSALYRPSRKSDADMLVYQEFIKRGDGDDV